MLTPSGPYTDEEVLVPPGASRAAARYIAARIEFETNTGCWLWNAGQTTDGYGAAGFRGLPRRAHRLSWLAHVGALPLGAQVLHRCDTPACVNPAHLFLGTHADNMRDASIKGRLRVYGARGEANGHAKLSATQAADIRKRFVRSGRYSNSRTLADEYGIGTGEVRQIARRQRWAHLSAEGAEPQ